MRARVRERESEGQRARKREPESASRANTCETPLTADLDRHTTVAVGAAYAVGRRALVGHIRAVLDRFTTPSSSPPDERVR